MALSVRSATSGDWFEKTLARRCRRLVIEIGVYAAVDQTLRQHRLMTDDAKLNLIPLRYESLMEYR